MWTRRRPAPPKPRRSPITLIRSESYVTLEGMIVVNVYYAGVESIAARPDTSEMSLTYTKTEPHE